jgi:hypothetical protein
MKFAVALSTIFLAFGTAVELRAQGSSTDHAVGLPSGSSTNTTTGIGTTSKNASGSTQSDDSKSDAEGDNTVYRMKSQDSLAAGAMSRDEGQLTRKPRRTEKILEVESTKQLPSSGTDPKFQGSLLHSSVTSIDDVGVKAGQDGEGQEQSGPRPLRHKIFITENSDESKKKESSHAKADSSPSPTPSPSVSPGAPSH